MQYNLGRLSEDSDNVYCLFFETLVKKSYFTCQDIKICENLNQSIKNKVYSEVDMDTDLIQTNEFLNTQRTREAKTYM
jgi:hypothetical protein